MKLTRIYAVFQGPLQVIFQDENNDLFNYFLIYSSPYITHCSNKRSLSEPIASLMKPQI